MQSSPPSIDTSSPRTPTASEIAHLNLCAIHHYVFERPLPPDAPSNAKAAFTRIMHVTPIVAGAGEERFYALIPVNEPIFPPPPPRYYEMQIEGATTLIEACAMYDATFDAFKAMMEKMIEDRHKQMQVQQRQQQLLLP